MFSFLFFFIISLFRYSHSIPWQCPSNASKCIKGPRHQSQPTDESASSNYKICLDYQKSSCCTPEFTSELSKSDVTHIDDGISIFNWSHCGGMSTQCEAFFIDIECFYRCSPNLIYFEGAFQSSLNRVPLCAGYCDSWFNACADDLSCVQNWAFGEYATSYQKNKNGVNVTINECPANSTCKTFKDLYTNGEGLCNILWGGSFNYTKNTELCLTPGYQRVNAEVNKLLFKECMPNNNNNNNMESSDEEDDDNNGVLIGGIVCLVIGVLCIIAALYMLYNNKKKQQISFDDETNPPKADRVTTNE